MSDPPRSEWPGLPEGEDIYAIRYPNLSLPEGEENLMSDAPRPDWPGLLEGEEYQ